MAMKREAVEQGGKDIGLPDDAYGGKPDPRLPATQAQMQARSIKQPKSRLHGSRSATPPSFALQAIGNPFGNIDQNVANNLVNDSSDTTGKPSAGVVGSAPFSLGNQPTQSFPPSNQTNRHLPLFGASTTQNNSFPPTQTYGIFGNTAEFGVSKFGYQPTGKNPFTKNTSQDKPASEPQKDSNSGTASLFNFGRISTPQSTQPENSRPTDSAPTGTIATPTVGDLNTQQNQPDSAPKMPDFGRTVFQNFGSNPNGTQSGSTGPSNALQRPSNPFVVNPNPPSSSGKRGADHAGLNVNQRQVQQSGPDLSRISPETFGSNPNSQQTTNMQNQGNHALGFTPLPGLGNNSQPQSANLFDSQNRQHLNQQSSTGNQPVNGFGGTFPSTQQNTNTFQQSSGAQGPSNFGNINSARLQQMQNSSEQETASTQGQNSFGSIDSSRMQQFQNNNPQQNQANGTMFANTQQGMTSNHQPGPAGPDNNMGWAQQLYFDSTNHNAAFGASFGANDNRAGPIAQQQSNGQNQGGFNGQNQGGFNGQDQSGFNGQNQGGSSFGAATENNNNNANDFGGNDNGAGPFGQQQFNGQNQGGSSFGAAMGNNTNNANGFGLQQHNAQISDQAPPPRSSEEASRNSQSQATTQPFNPFGSGPPNSATTGFQQQSAASTNVFGQSQNAQLPTSSAASNLFGQVSSAPPQSTTPSTNFSGLSQASTHTPGQPSTASTSVQPAKPVADSNLFGQASTAPTPTPTQTTTLNTNPPVTVSTNPSTSLFTQQKPSASDTPSVPASQPTLSRTLTNHRPAESQTQSAAKPSSVPAPAPALGPKAGAWVPPGLPDARRATYGGYTDIKSLNQGFLRSLKGLDEEINWSRMAEAYLVASEKILNFTGLSEKAKRKADTQEPLTQEAPASKRPITEEDGTASFMSPASKAQSQTSHLFQGIVDANKENPASTNPTKPTPTTTSTSRQINPSDKLPSSVPPLSFFTPQPAKKSTPFAAPQSASQTQQRSALGHSSGAPKSAVKRQAAPMKTAFIPSAFTADAKPNPFANIPTTKTTPFFPTASAVRNSIERPAAIPEAPDSGSESSDGASSRSNRSTSKASDNNSSGSNRSTSKASDKTSSSSGQGAESVVGDSVEDESGSEDPGSEKPEGEKPESHKSESSKPDSGKLGRSEREDSLESYEYYEEQEREAVAQQKSAQNANVGKSMFDRVTKPGNSTTNSPRNPFGMDGSTDESEAAPTPKSFFGQIHPGPTGLFSSSVGDTSTLFGVKPSPGDNTWKGQENSPINFGNSVNGASAKQDSSPTPTPSKDGPSKPANRPFADLFGMPKADAAPSLFGTPNLTTPSLFGKSPAPATANPGTAGFGFNSTLHVPTATPSLFSGSAAASRATTPGIEASGASASEAETNADDPEKPLDQTDLTAVSTEELCTEDIVFEIPKARLMKFVKGQSEPYVVQGTGPLRLMKNKTTGAVRLVIRNAPRGNVLLNDTLQPGMSPNKSRRCAVMLGARDSAGQHSSWCVRVREDEVAQQLLVALQQSNPAS